MAQVMGLPLAYGIGAYPSLFKATVQSRSAHWPLTYDSLEHVYEQSSYSSRTAVGVL